MIPPATSIQEIYQHYHRGPVAVLRLFERVFESVSLYGSPSEDQQERSLRLMSEEVDRLKAQIENQDVEIGRLRQRNYELERRNSELESNLVKDSHNSSRPPSTDPPWGKRTKSLRQPSTRRPGGQPGHKGQTKTFAAHPTKQIVHRPAQCRHCQTSLETATVVRNERRQIIDIVPARLRVTEHRAEVRRCAGCGKTTKGEFPAEAKSAVQYGPGVKARAVYLLHYQMIPYRRTREAMRDLFGCDLSSGTINNIVEEAGSRLIEAELKIKKKLRRAPVIHVDETGLRVNKQCYYVHLTSTPKLTHYLVDPHRGKAAVEAIDILPRYRGTCVHDGWPIYSLYSRCTHALCGAHLLRELVFFIEANAEQKSWAEPLKRLLLEIKSEVERGREAGQRRLDAERQSAFIARYQAIIHQGLKLNRSAESKAGSDKVQDRRETDGLRKQAGRLLRRMDHRRSEVLRFMTDFSIPFDNNLAERDLRMVKLKQKISGGFRASQGARTFCRLRAYLSTLSKQRRHNFSALKSLFHCQTPAFTS